MKMLKRILLHTFSWTRDLNSSNGFEQSSFAKRLLLSSSSRVWVLNSPHIFPNDISRFGVS